jgi:hypothetical protein
MLDWTRLANDLDAQGSAVLAGLLTPQASAKLAALYPVDKLFRTRVVMGRHGFGRGEYKYFAYPLPDPVARLRAALYPQLAELANRWNSAMGIATRFPDDHAAYIRRCHAAGQRKPTPLLLQYGAGDYNCLHQDLYGEQVFPLQLTILLSKPGGDFTDGEFVMTEQRPVKGTRGVYRVNLRHGVSRVRSGQRHTAGIIFHDAR